LAGKFDRCQELIASAPPSDQRTLAQARLDLIQGRYLEVIEHLAAASVAPQLAAERQIVLGAAFGLTNDFEVAHGMFDQATANLAGGDDALRDEARYYQAFIAWNALDYRRAEAEAAQLLGSADPNARARAHLLLAWIAKSRLDTRAQIERYLCALDEFALARPPDQVTRASALVSLLALCREMQIPEALQRARQAYDAIEWVDGLVAAYFEATRHLGWIDALAGDTLAAFRWLRLASQRPPTEAWRIIALLDRAYLAKCTGEIAFAHELLYDAHASAKEFEWPNDSQQRATAFILFAELFSDVDPAIAHAYLARLRSVSSSNALGYDQRRDPRARAIANYSMAIAYVHLGQPEDAQELLLESWAVFEESRYGWRAALCALELFRLTRDDLWLSRARTRITPWPNSWIAKDVAAADQPVSKIDTLPKRHREVLELLLQGKSNPQIARELARNQNTVRNQVAELFDVFDVKTRAQLVAVVTSASPGARLVRAPASEPSPSQATRKASSD
jgi:DNA-binding CsgD family transcriptional regulator